MTIETALTRHAGIRVPILCGAMYPCSNPELVAAASEAGAMGIVQPLSLVYVHGHEFRAGLRLIRRLTDKPYGINVIVEKSSKIYEDRMRRYVDEALEEGARFFVTALGNPRWVVDKVHAAGGVVYHDVTERKWAQRALDERVDGLICVNSRAGGHAGRKSPRQLMDELGDLGVPLVCAGGVGSPGEYADALALGYAGVQMGTRFIASAECKVHEDYKQAILRAREQDIVLTDKISGVPCAVIKTPFIEKMGTKAGFVARMLLKNRRTKHWMRTLYGLQSIWHFKRAALKGTSYKDYFQAGKSVEGIDRVMTVAEIVEQYEAATRERATAS